MNHAGRTRAITLFTAMTMLLGGTATAQVAAQTDYPDGDIGTQIVGGWPATQPYTTAAIEYDSTTPARTDWLNCTGNLLRTYSATESDWVVTAAHCATNLPADVSAAGLSATGLGARPDFHAPPV
ncbi:hypothetical protein [Umezawaea sp. Da 62-37]|uniref:hypothetical protein n=1 Tax=Umezawaea sp. Da 62-37 TaxID=3075927 RepID=UPI0028F730C4|nr:hypothetical protein [Umezawaea sp. Da 62-37]WNV84966.1 hypothetical protein RM788_43560 [Umezawaea sp. Da 62-37]